MVVLDLPEPDCASGRVRFKIVRRDLGSTTASARGGGVQAGFPLWRAEYQFDRMDARSGDIWRAFLDRLRGRQRLFLGGDTARPYPIAYANGFTGLVRASGPAAGQAFDGEAGTGWSQTIGAEGDAIIGIPHGLPAGLILNVGDYIGWKWDAAGEPAGSFRRAALARIVEPAISTGAGTALIKIEPPIDQRVVPATAIVHFNEPRCMLRLVPGDSDLSGVGSGSAYDGGRIVAMQELWP